MSKNYRKVVLEPNHFIEGENEEDTKFFFDFLRDSPPDFCAALFKAVGDMEADMYGTNKPTPEPECKATHEIPKIEKEEDDDFLNLKVITPSGLRKEGVEVYLENGVLVINVEQKLTTGESSSPSSSYGVEKDKGLKGPKFLIRHVFEPTELCNQDKVKAKIKDGVVSVVCPKLAKKKEENRKVGVHRVQLDD